MSNKDKNTNSSQEMQTVSNLPGVDNRKVIDSFPIYIKENAWRPSKKPKDRK